MCKKSVAFCDMWSPESGSCNIAFPGLLQSWLILEMKTGRAEASSRGTPSCSKLVTFHASGEFQAFWVSVQNVHGYQPAWMITWLLLHLRSWHLKVKTWFNWCSDYKTLLMTTDIWMFWMVHESHHQILRIFVYVFCLDFGLKVI